MVAESRAAALKAHYLGQMEKARAERAEREARQLAIDTQAWKELEATIEADILTRVLPEGVTIKWDDTQSRYPRMTGMFIVPHDDGANYEVRFSIRDQVDRPDFRVLIARDDWRTINPPHLAEFIGAAIAYIDMRRETEEQQAAQRAAYAAEEEKRNAEWQAAQAQREAERQAAQAQREAERQAAQAQREAERQAERQAETDRQAAAKAARRADRLARKVAEAEAIAIAELRARQLYHVNPSGFVADDLDRWAQQAIDTATDAGDRLPQVEQLRAEIAIYERQLKEAQAAATWSVNGANETERKNNAAKALAADPEVKRIQAALDGMNRQLAVIEPEYKAVAMRSGAWRAVCELYAGWLQSLR